MYSKLATSASRQSHNKMKNTDSKLLLLLLLLQRDN